MKRNFWNGFPYLGEAIMAMLLLLAILFYKERIIIDAAYQLFAIVWKEDFAIQVGRFASPFGSYPGRHLTPVDPFIRPPLPYDYRTINSRTVAPPNASRYLS